MLPLSIGSVLEGITDNCEYIHIIKKTVLVQEESSNCGDSVELLWALAIGLVWITITFS
jgi:hypothetical protein